MDKKYILSALKRYSTANRLNGGTRFMANLKVEQLQYPGPHAHPMKFMVRISWLNGRVGKGQNIEMTKHKELFQYCRTKGEVKRAYLDAFVIISDFIAEHKIPDTTNQSIKIHGQS
jgi:hypothetical protein